MVYLEGKTLKIGDPIIAWLIIDEKKVQAFTATESKRNYAGHIGPDGFIYIGEECFPNLKEANKISYTLVSD